MLKIYSWLLRRSAEQGLKRSRVVSTMRKAFMQNPTAGDRVLAWKYAAPDAAHSQGRNAAY